METPGIIQAIIALPYTVGILLIMAAIIAIIAIHGTIRIFNPVGQALSATIGVTTGITDGV
jgi:hypothetical protein